MVEEEWTVKVHQNGSIVLCDELVCDGFLNSAPLRVQTHIHGDHMSQFGRSLSGEILCLPATKDLLSTDLKWRYRSNILAVEEGIPYELPSGCGFVKLYPTDHMLGSAQVVVENYSNGLKTGYTGDFGEDTQPIQVDELVIDATSSPTTIRYYSQEDAEDALVALVREYLLSRGVIVTGDVESVFRAIDSLDMFDRTPMFADEIFLKYADVYAKHGRQVPRSLSSIESADEEVRSRGGYIYFRSKGPKYRDDNSDPVYVRLMPWYTTENEPLIWSVPGHRCDVGITNHADFMGTLEYVKNSGAKRVLLDNIRGARAADLRNGLWERTEGIEYSYDWIPQERGWGS